MQPSEAGAANNAEAASSNANSSFPLVDFISRWRLRGRGRPGLEVGDDDADAPSSPLLLNRFSMAVSSPSPTAEDHDDVPYPLPEAFLPLSAASKTASESYEEEEYDDDDDAQSIKSYCSDQIRTYDRISRVSWPPDLLQIRDEAAIIIDDDDDNDGGDLRGCVNPFPLSTICMSDSANVNGIEMQPSDTTKNSSSKTKSTR
jgi:hypothetical protein